jgi:hypothetical protein
LIYSQLLTEPARRKLGASPAGTDLYLRLDEQLLQVPWELCYDGREFLATKFRVGRQVITERAPARSFGSASDPTAVDPLDMLIVADPTESLPAALEEARAVEQQLHRRRGVRVRRIAGADVRRVALLQALARSTIVHFAGHSVYHPEDPTRSGWVLRDGVLSTSEIAKLDRLPVLVFSNSCHAGATTGWEGATAYEGQAFGIGSAFLLAGVRNYIGTFWVTHDEESARFARAFYESLLRGDPVGQALQAARSTIVTTRGWNDLTWASYMLYGDPAFRLPLPDHGASEAPTEAKPHATTVLATPPRRAPARRRLMLGAGGATAVAGAVVAGWIATGSAPRPSTAEPRAMPTVVASPTIVGTPVSSRVRSAFEILEAPNVSVAVKLALVREAAGDQSDDATGILLAATANAAEEVSVESLIALRGRRCELVEDGLRRSLDATHWASRAWAAKVLSDNGCRDSLPALSAQLAVERDPRVRENLLAAIDKLAKEADR